MKQLHFCLFVSLLAFSLTATGCQTPATSVTTNNLQVLVTIPTLYSLTLNIVSDSAQVDYLLPPGASPHDYSLKPSDLNKISKADVLIMNGLQLEGFIQDAIASADNANLQVVVASAGITTLPGDPDTGDKDPHVWLSLTNAISQVQTITQALAKADPIHATQYQTNATTYIEQLTQLDDYAKQQLSNVPHKNFIALHPAWAYFAHDYQLTQVAAIEVTPGQEPSAQAIAALMTAITTYDIPALFSEPQLPNNTVNSLARDTNLPVYEVDPEGSSVPFDANLYAAMMRKNIDTFARALR